MSIFAFIPSRSKKAVGYKYMSYIFEIRFGAERENMEENFLFMRKGENKCDY